MSGAAFVELGALECDAICLEVPEWRCGLQQIVVAGNNEQPFRFQIGLSRKSKAGELN